jgi:hypothetical protein
MNNILYDRPLAISFKENFETLNNLYKD